MKPTEADDEEAEVKIMEESATFSELVVWGHEMLPEDTSDPFVRGIEEWIGFASKVRHRLQKPTCCRLMLMMWKIHSLPSVELAASAQPKP
jgi:hypothetical protein